MCGNRKVCCKIDQALFCVQVEVFDFGFEKGSTRAYFFSFESFRAHCKVKRER